MFSLKYLFLIFECSAPLAYCYHHLPSVNKGHLLFFIVISGCYIISEYEIGANISQEIGSFYTRNALNPSGTNLANNDSSSACASRRSSSIKTDTRPIIQLDELS